MEKLKRIGGQIVVIVDAVSTGKYFAPLARKRGYRSVHILSHPNAADHILSTFRPQDFIENILYDGNIGAVIEALKKYSVALVLPGSELGVQVADALSKALGLPSNDTTISLARRNKYMMQETLRARGLRCIKEKLSNNPDEIISWAEGMGTWPVVLKPVECFATEGVRFCANVSDVKSAFTAIMHHMNSSGFENKSVLAQEFIEGKECVVNTVSLKGEHYITDYWEYKKIVLDNGAPVYDYARLLPYPPQDATELVCYTAKTLDALGFLNGPAHAEIKMTVNGPVLIEVGARVMGGSVPPDIVSECIGHNQVDLALDSFLNEKQFLKHVERPYRLVKHCIVKILIAYKAGRIIGMPGLEIIKALPSVREVRIPFKTGDTLSKTTDMIFNPGTIILVHEDPLVLEADYRRISELEVSGLFDLR